MYPKVHKMSDPNQTSTSTGNPAGTGQPGGTIPRTPPQNQAASPNLPALPPRADAVSVNTKVRLPEFFKENVDLWFWQVECAFTAASITADARRYNAIIGQLPPQVIFKLADFKDRPPPANAMYDTLKERIIREYGDSQLTRITKLLEDMALGDRKPSQLLADMRAKAASTDINESLLQQLWMRNLSSTIRAILSADSVTPLQEKAATADRIHEAITSGSIQSRSISAIEQTPSQPANQTKSSTTLDELKAMVNDLAKQVKNIRSRSKTRSETPAKKRDSSEKRVYENCWWHHKFGSNAQKCKEPCAFKNKTEN